MNRCGLTTTYNAVRFNRSNLFFYQRCRELFPFNMAEFEESGAKREEIPFVFTHKGLPLPSDTVIHYRPLPDNYEQWDEDLRRVYD